MCLFIFLSPLDSSKQFKKKKLPVGQGERKVAKSMKMSCVVNKPNNYSILLLYLNVYAQRAEGERERREIYCEQHRLWPMTTYLTIIYLRMIMKRVVDADDDDNHRTKFMVLRCY